MAVDAGRYRRGSRWQADRVAKERRQKQVLVGASALLAVVVAIQVPRMLHRGGGASPAPTPAPAPTRTDQAVSTSQEPDLGKRNALLRAFRAKDPFLVEVAGAGKTAVGFKPAVGPWVRSIDFVPKDPFAIRAGGSAAHRRATPPARRAPIAGRREYVVVLASVPVAEGYKVAARIAHRARVRGIAAARVLDSSAYRSLRHGFYVVFGGTYRTARDAQRGLAAARRSGFPKAYTRPLSR